MDADILLWIQDNIRNVFWNPVMSLITHLGDAGMFWIVLAVCFLMMKKNRRLGAVMLLAMICSFAINNLVLKNLVARIRPYEVVDGLELLVGKARDFSFPSGHSATSFAAAVPIVRLKGWRFGVWFVLLAGAIAFSRLYVGIHYPTDVLFGIGSGAIIGYVVSGAFLAQAEKERY